MDFDLTDDQREIQRTARDLLAARYKPEESGAWPTRPSAASPTSGWAELVRARLAGAAVAEEHGGQGLGVVELAVVQEELGAALRAVAVPVDRRRRPR